MRRSEPLRHRRLLHSRTRNDAGSLGPSLLEPARTREAILRNLGTGGTYKWCRCRSALVRASVFLLTAATLGVSAHGQDTLYWRGVSLAGAEFGVGPDGAGNIPGVFGIDYIYPNQGEVDYFQGKGMNLIRLPFRWERLQQSLYGDLDAAELSRLREFVEETTAKGVLVLLDPHNYAGYYTGPRQGRLGGAIPDDALADFWARLALEFRDDIRVMFGLMNEPIELSGEDWVEAANAAIAAIRSVGAEQTILVPGVAYSGAHSWLQDWYGTPNGETMLGIIDPNDNFLIEVHQYLDEDYSGTQEECLSAPAGSQALVDFTNWLREEGVEGFLGEFGIRHNENCLDALADMLSYVESNTDVWRGWTYWAAGPWWGDADTLEPIGGEDREPMAVLDDYLLPGPPPLCFGRFATIVAGGFVPATNGPDIVVGSLGDDTVEGLAGDDWICALGGDDLVVGSTGRDTMDLGAGRDEGYGGPGDDRMRGGSGGDQLRGGSGSDRLDGGTGFDTCWGGSDGEIDRARCEEEVDVP